MVVAFADRKILLKSKQRSIYYCSICGKKLRFSGRSEYSLACWECMIVNADP
jgi:hypothetical protein